MLDDLSLVMDGGFCFYELLEIKRIIENKSILHQELYSAIFVDHL